MRRISVRKVACIVALFSVATAIASHAQTVNVVADFNGKNGDAAAGPLVQGVNGNFYGTTAYGGAHNSDQSCSGFGCGTVFEITPAGKLTTLYNFCSQTGCLDGATPGALVLGTNGNFYGTTWAGGTYNLGICGHLGCGTIFEITPAGKLTTLYRFCAQTNCADGTQPGALVQAANGNLYGAAAVGGIRNGDAGCPTGCGTIFDITPKGKMTTLYRFCPQDGQCPNGYSPESVIQATNGNFYGLALYGGTNGAGTVFEMTPAGNVSALYSFCELQNCADGGRPSGMLLQAANRNLYGTTYGYGANLGTVFEITPAGNLTTLYSFCAQTNCADGSGPHALVQGTDKNFYGTTAYGGAHNSEQSCSGVGCGTVFEITPGGKLTTLYSFCSEANCTDGAVPGVLMQATNGTFYGGTGYGGADYRGCIISAGCGDIFSLSVGLGPFVRANPDFGKVGYKISILGNNLTSATNVTFNGMPATFTVVSNTYIKATVPPGATTGPIEVTTSSGTLSSNVAFKVE